MYPFSSSLISIPKNYDTYISILKPHSPQKPPPHPLRTLLFFPFSVVSPSVFPYAAPRRLTGDSPSGCFCKTSRPLLSCFFSPLSFSLYNAFPIPFPSSLLPVTFSIFYLYSFMHSIHSAGRLPRTYTPSTSKSFFSDLIRPPNTALHLFQTIRHLHLLCTPPTAPCMRSFKEAHYRRSFQSGITNQMSLHGSSS